MGTEALLQDTASIPNAKAQEGLGKYYGLFFISGFPALIYQIVWQRALFTIYGVNIESVTVIVAMFMLGLGLGSLAGGQLSTTIGTKALRYFGLIELSIGIFGLLSLHLFRIAATFTAGTSTWAVGVASFVLLLIPTLLMGSTLPLLVAHLVRRSTNVGESVGALYAVNTLGSSVACFFAALLLMRVFGQAGSVALAAVCNFFVAGTALFLGRSKVNSNQIPLPVIQAADTAKPVTIPLKLGMLLAGVTGFIALAYEVLWYRIYSYTSAGRASCFAELLGAYLFGIAYGAFAVHDACKAKLRFDLRATLDGCSRVVFVGTIVAFLVAPAVSFLVAVAKTSFELTFVLVVIAAALLGAAFPLVCHATIDPSTTPGKKTSYLYLANILGSVLGSYIIGFEVFDRFSLSETSFFLLLLGLIVSLAFTVLAGKRRFGLIGGIAVASFSILFVCRGQLFGHIYERLLFKSFYGRDRIYNLNRGETQFNDLVENRSGVIAVSKREIVYGGGAYDGAFSIDPVHDRNGIFRAYAIPTIHPNPKHVLIIGLSSGSWAQILTNDPRVEDVTIVEINPGYLPLIRQRPQIASLLQNPKVHIVIDDGRRWLVGHPERSFDFILMNTTFNWRANITNLLSVEFLQLIRNHLNRGGVLYYNTTHSGEVELTGATVYPFALRIGNFLAVSDSPIVFDRPRLEGILAAYEIDGRPIFDRNDPASEAALQRIVSLPTIDHEDAGGGVSQSIEDRSSLLARNKGMQIITDDNMGTEWKPFN